MLNILSKPRDDITVADVQALVETNVPENENIEFKEKLPTPTGKPSPWPGHINKEARNALLEESVAFANAYGGALVLGVSDSNGAAAGICPVPQCDDLAERLRIVFRDCVEPQLPHIEIFAVVVQDSAGVVIIRASRSRLAPHRVTTTRVCPIRRADRCEPMTMREIQDMTINLSRGLQRIEDALSQRSALFSQEFDRLQTPNDAFGLRLTAIPVAEDIRNESLLRNHQPETGLRPPNTNPVRRLPGQDSPHVLQGIEHLYDARHDVWEPRLRAVRSESPYQRDSAAPGLDFNSYRELHANGLLEIGMVAVAKTPSLSRPGRNLHQLHYELPVVEFAILASWADQVRLHAQAPAAEYAIDVQITARGLCQVCNAVSRRMDPYGTFEDQSVAFPKYSLGHSEDIPNLLAVFERDFWNSFRKEFAGDQGLLAIE